MKTLASTFAALGLALHAGAALALPGTFGIDQAYSNADGTVQFIEVFDAGARDCDANEQAWKGLELRSYGPGGGKSYLFPGDLPHCRTSQKHILIATQGFAALGLVTPDFVIPNGFLPLTAGTIDFAQISSITYTALPTDGVMAIDAFGRAVPNLAVNLAGAQASLTGNTAPPSATVVEYYHAGLDHYFITWIAAEIALLDEGVKIKGWARTGVTFRAYTASTAASSPICRFYIPPALGDSHFFGRGVAECSETAAKLPDLVLEDPAFMHLVLPQAGVCPAGMRNIYRVYSNRADANHRYMTDPAVRDAMAARGWLPEGDGPDRVVMCAPA